jgi:hypothetical protein
MTTRVAPHYFLNWSYIKSLKITGQIDGWASARSSRTARCWEASNVICIHLGRIQNPPCSLPNALLCLIKVLKTRVMSTDGLSIGRHTSFHVDEKSSEISCIVCMWFNWFLKFELKVSYNLESIIWLRLRFHNRLFFVGFHLCSIGYLYTFEINGNRIALKKKIKKNKNIPNGYVVKCIKNITYNDQWSWKIDSTTVFRTFISSYKLSTRYDSPYLFFFIFWV